jgi:hypothetical protein
MALLQRIGIRAPAPIPAPAAMVVVEGPELGDDELEQVVGGLERVYVPGIVVAADY